MPEKLLVDPLYDCLNFGESESSGLSLLGAFQPLGFSYLTLANVIVKTGLSGRLGE